MDPKNQVLTVASKLYAEGSHPERFAPGRRSWSVHKRAHRGKSVRMRRKGSPSSFGAPPKKNAASVFRQAKYHCLLQLQLQLSQPCSYSDHETSLRLEYV